MLYIIFIFFLIEHSANLLLSLVEFILPCGPLLLICFMLFYNIVFIFSIKFLCPHVFSVLHPLTALRNIIFTSCMSIFLV